MLEAGANPNTVDDTGRTPLIMAAESSHEFKVELLLQHNANVNIPELSGGFSPLYVASLWGSIETVKLLLDAGADVDYQRHNGKTALHAAVEEGRKDCVVALLKAGADRKIKCKKLKTAQDYITDKAPFITIAQEDILALLNNYTLPEKQK